MSERAPITDRDPLESRAGPLSSPARLSAEELESAGSGKALHPLASLRAHKLVALTVAVLVTLIGLPIAYVEGTAVYSTTSVIHVSPRFIRNLANDQELELQSNTQYRHFVQQQVRTINRYDIVRNALEQNDVARAVWQMEGETLRRAAERLQGALSIRPVPDTYLITVSLRSEDPQGLHDVVNAVVREYLATSKSEEVYGADERIEKLLERRDALLAHTRELVAERSVIAQELGVTTFNENLLNPYDQLLMKSNEALANARMRRFEAEARLAAFDEDARVGGGAALDALAWEQVYQDPGIASLKANINTRRQRIVTSMSGLSDQHVGKAQGRDELEDLEASLAELETQLFEKFRREIRAKIEAEAYQAREIERNIAREMRAQEEKASWFARRYNDALASSQEIARARAQLDDIKNRVDFLELETQAPGWVRRVEIAREPQIPVSGGRKKLAILFAFAGLALGLALPVAIDVLDRRVRYPGQLLPIFGFPPTGSVLERLDDATAEYAEDQLLRIASAIERDRRATGTRTILLSSAKPGGGATTLAFELGRHFVRLGLRTLLVEANAFKPDARFGISPAGGTADVLAGRVALSEAVVRGRHGAADRLPIGGAGDERHLRSVGELPRLFEDALAHYDLVLVDAPPILVSADAELLAPLVDAVLAVVEADALSVGEVKRAASTFEKADPQGIGTIFNRMRVLRGGGYLAGALREYETAEKVEPRVITSPWLWK